MSKKLFTFQYHILFPGIQFCMGGIARNTDGDIIFAYSIHLGCSIILMTVIYAIFLGLKHALEKGITRIITNSLNAVNIIHNGCAVEVFGVSCRR